MSAVMKDEAPNQHLDPEVREILTALSPSGASVDEAITLPPACYTSERWFEFEKQAIWDREWICVGHVGHIPKPGDYVSININDDPLLVLRDPDGEVRVMSAVCQHRGYVLGEERGNCRSFTCPFHGWCYDMKGKLVAAPEMDGHVPLDKLTETHSLPVLRSEIWNGFIFVNMDGKAEPLAPRLKRLTDQVANHRMGELGAVPTLDWPGNPWNWKFMHENAIEPHHTMYLHKGVHDFAPSRLASFFEWDENDDGAVFHPTGFLQRDGNFTAGFRSMFPPLPDLTDEERQRVMFACVLPNLFFGAVPDGVLFYIILPQGANAITLRVGFLYPQETLRSENFNTQIKAVVDGLSIFNDQDTVANTKTHLGLKSRFANRSRYAPKEETLAQMNRWLIKRYQAMAAELEPGRD